MIEVLRETKGDGWRRLRLRLSEVEKALFISSSPLWVLKKNMTKTTIVEWMKEDNYREEKERMGECWDLYVPDIGGQRGKAWFVDSISFGLVGWLVICFVHTFPVDCK